MSFFTSEKFSIPIKYDDTCIFNEDHLLMDGEMYPYDELCTIIYSGNSKYMNGVQLNKKIELTLLFIKKGELPYPFNIDNVTGFAKFNFERGLLPTNVRSGKVLEFVYEYICKRTFNQRLKLFKDTLKKYDKFSFYEGLPEFHNNGDLYDRGKFEGNFREMNEKGKIINGERYGGYSNKVNDPFIYGFERGTKFFGMIADNVTFSNTVNRDVLFTLLDNLYSTGKMLD